MKNEADNQQSIKLNATHRALLDDVVRKTATLTGETPEEVRRAVELSVLTRGLAWVREELG